MTFSPVLFDLDDTLMDYQYGRRCGLRALQEKYPALAAVSLTELELGHDAQLQANYAQTLDGRLSLEEGRIARIRGLCQPYNLALAEEEVHHASQLFQTQYQANRRPVPGSIALLQWLRGKVGIGIVTNGPSVLQREKVQLCGFDAVVYCATLQIRLSP